MSSTGSEYNQLSADIVHEKTPLIAMEDDFIKIPGQNYAVVSFVDASQYTKARITGHLTAPMHLIKVRGIFSSQKSAEDHVAQMQSMDTHFDYHIIETHKWTTIGAATASEQVYQDDQVQEVMSEYFEKEDDTLANLQERINLAKTGNQRSDESTQFFEDSQKMNAVPDSTKYPKMEKMTLDEAQSFAAS